MVNFLDIFWTQIDALPISNTLKSLTLFIFIFRYSCTAEKHVISPKPQTTYNII